jgi:hypothetical protein
MFAARSRPVEGGVMRLYHFTDLYYLKNGGTIPEGGTQARH